MEKHFFRYQILRYIADLRRMETENIGVVVQGAKAVSCRFHTSLGSRRDFDFDNYRHWREFFDTEINAPAVPLFQPARTSIEFLKYLQERCNGNYSLTRPLELVLDSDALENAENYLFRTLVLKPDETVRKIKQPVQKLRSELARRKILNNHSFHTKQLFNAPGLTEFVEYFYVRNHGANLPVIIQPVQVLTDISRTINAMERAEALVANLREAKVRAEISVVVDEISAPDNSESDTKKWAYERIYTGKKVLQDLDANIVDSTTQTLNLVNTVEKDLEGNEPDLPQKAMAYG